jgi:hypothetical protein
MKNKKKFKTKLYTYLYLVFNEISGKYKFGISNDIPRRLSELNGLLIDEKDCRAIANASDLEDKIKLKYSHFRISASDAKALGIPPSGASEYYGVTKEQAQYMFDWALGYECGHAVSPFAILWLEEYYLNKDIHQRSISSLNTTIQYRDSLISPSHAKNIKDAIEVDGEIKTPLLVDASSNVYGGIHRLDGALGLNYKTVPVKVVDEKWIEHNDLKDIAVMLNNNQFNSVSLANSTGDIQHHMRSVILDYKEIKGISIENAIAHFIESNAVDSFVKLFHMTKNSVSKNLSHTILKLKEEIAIDNGMFKPVNRDSIEVIEARDRAIIYHKDRVVVVHIAEKFSDAIGHCIREMVNQNNKKGLIITYRSFRHRKYSNSDDKVWLSALKAQSGYDVILEEIDQITTNRATKILAKEDSEEDLLATADVAIVSD